jgi:ATP-binding cassette subfamily D (ALD) long-chain fatty acid import protein
MSESSPHSCYPLTPCLPHQVPIRPTSELLFLSHRPHFPLLSASAQSKPNVDRTFFRQLLAILRITFPSYRSPEVGIVLVHSTFLVLRTVLSIGIAKLDGKIVKALVCKHSLTSMCKCANVKIQVSADGRGFLRGLGLWFLLAIPSTYTNSMVLSLECIHPCAHSDFF